MAIGTIPLNISGANTSSGFNVNRARIDRGGPKAKLLFSATETQSSIWEFQMPVGFASALVAVIPFSMASATTGKIDVEVEIMAVAPGDPVNIDIASFDSPNKITGGTTVPGTAGFPEKITLPLINDDSIVAGSLVTVRISRDHDDVNDTATGDLELRETINLNYTTT